LHLGDVASTPLPSSAYDLCMLVLVDEHLAEIEPVYREAARLLAADGHFVLIGCSRRTTPSELVRLRTGS
jgi:SAM-dependent methyltransferase